MNEDIIMELEDLKRQIEMAIGVIRTQPFIIDFSARIQNEHYDFSVGDFFVYRHSNRGHLYED